MNSSYFLHIFDTKPYGLPNLLEFLKGMDGLLDFGANFPPKFKLPAFKQILNFKIQMLVVGDNSWISFLISRSEESFDFSIFHLILIFVIVF